MLSLANIYTLYFRLYFRLCICLNKLSINNILNRSKCITCKDEILTENSIC